MNLKIYPKRHCIETEIKRQYNLSVSDYFKADTQANKKALENRIELLHHAIETLDFNFLRNSYTALRENSSAEVCLEQNDTGDLGIKINGEEIETTDKD